MSCDTLHGTRRKTRLGEIGMHPILGPDPQKADGLRNNIGMRRERLPAGTGQLPGVEEKRKEIWPQRSFRAFMGRET